MLGIFSTTYLFLGGAGAGVLACLSLVSLFWLDKGTPGFRWSISRDTSHFYVAGYITGLLTIMFGVMCLLFDLGNADAIVSLFTYPPFTYIGFGTWCLTICALLGGLLLLCFRGLIPCGRKMLNILSAVALIPSVALMVYTGLLLASIQAVPLWHSFFVPVLFTLSSFSCGIVVLVLVCVCLFMADLSFIGTALRKALRVDTTVIFFESVTVVLFIASIALQIEIAHYNGGVNYTEQALEASFAMLTSESMAALFFGLFVISGLLLPFMLDMLILKSELNSSTVIVVAISVICVLVGAYLMRYCIVMSGMHPLLVS